MASSGFTPVNQVRLTNVAYVRLQRGGKRFEVACYRNKALSWRNKIETDINEVLQIDSVFSNVSKGMLANKKDIEHAFGTTDKIAVCIEILNKGELQVSEQERVALQDTTFKDIASIVADKTLNPETDRPYTVAIIQHAMREIQISVSTGKSSKSQALDVIRRLKEVMPIRRTRMTLRIHINAEDGGATGEEVVRAVLRQQGALLLPTTDAIESGLGDHLDFEIEPDAFRALDAAVKAVGGVRMEVLQLRSSGTGAAPSAPAVTPPLPPTSSTGLSGASLPSAPGGEGAGGAGGEKTLTNVDDADDDDFDIDNDTDEEEEGEAQEGEGGQMGGDGDALGHVTVPPSYNRRLERSQEKKRAKKQKQQRELAEKDKHRGDAELAATEEKPQPPQTRSDPHLQTSGASSLVGAGAGDAAGKGDRRSKQSKRVEKEVQQEREKQRQVQAQAAARRQEQQQEQRTASAAPASLAAGAGAGEGAGAEPKVQSCNTCGGGFLDAATYRQHFRSDWHRFNLNRKLKGEPVLTEADYETLQLA